jgi:hypothetical protein
MNDNFKKILIVVGVVAVYYYFFRNVIETNTSARPQRKPKGWSIADDILNGIDTITPPKSGNAIIDRIPSSTPVSSAPKGISNSTDSNTLTNAGTSVNVLQ